MNLTCDGDNADGDDDSMLSAAADAVAVGCA
jgi:hypothetical protein